MFESLIAAGNAWVDPEEIAAAALFLAQTIRFVTAGVVCRRRLLGDLKSHVDHRRTFTRATADTNAPGAVEGRESPSTRNRRIS
jgi:hypothetical protein